MADRSTILAALRGARPCPRHADIRLDFPACLACRESIADAVLAATQPPGDAAALRSVLLGAYLGMERVALRLPNGHPAADDLHDAMDAPWDALDDGQRAVLNARAATPEPPYFLPCGHPHGAATTPDHPPHDGSTWTCAWCADRDGLREAQAAALAEIHKALGLRGDHGPEMNLKCALDAIVSASMDRGEADREHAEELAAAQARAGRLASLVRDFAHSCACPEGVRPCRPFMHNDRACETIAAALLDAEAGP